MKEEFGQLCHWWDNSFEQIKGYFCSRKYNGWSALWDGGITIGKPVNEIPWFNKTNGDGKISTGLWSLGRNNKTDVLNAPKYFIDKLPEGVPLHGELWYNDRLDIIKKTCGTRKYFEPMWHNVQFVAFNIKPYNKWFNSVESLNSTMIIDGVNLTTALENAGDRPYFYTQNLLGRYVNDTVITPVNIIINSVGDLKTIQEQAINHRWEGLIFNNPNGLYECGRSYNSLKWKPECENEAEIIGYAKGKTGKNIGKVGSIIVKLTWDEQVLSLHGGMEKMVNKSVEFKVGGLEDEERIIDKCLLKYKVGSMLPFTFYGVSFHGIPQNNNINRLKSLNGG